MQLSETTAFRYIAVLHACIRCACPSGRYCSTGLRSSTCYGADSFTFMLLLFLSFPACNVALKMPHLRCRFCLLAQRRRAMRRSVLLTGLLLDTAMLPICCCASLPLASRLL